MFWEEGKAPAGNYQVYVHHYKKHDKRKSKDPTKFQVIVNQGGVPYEYNGELSAGDPILMVAEFNLPSPEEREANKRELERELASFSEGSSESKVDEAESAETTEDVDELPGAPDLDALLDQSED